MINKKSFLTIYLFFAIIFNYKICVAEVFEFEVGDENAQVNCNGRTIDAPCIVIDSDGHRLGYNPMTNEIYRELYGSYGTTGLGCIDCEGPVRRRDTHEISFNLKTGNYIIEIIGKGITEYEAGIYISNRIKDESDSFKIAGVIDKDLTAKYQVSYSSELTTPWTLIRMATPASFKQDITLSRKIAWIKNDGIMKSLLQKADAIDSSISKGNKEAAKNQLNAFINEVNAQKGKQIDDKAVTMLLEDVQYLIDHL